VLTENDSIAIVGSWDNSIYVYSMVYGRILERTEAHAAGVSCLDLEVQGDTLVSGSWDGEIKVWKLRRGRAGHGTIRLELSMELTEPAAGHDAEITCVAITTKTGECVCVCVCVCVRERESALSEKGNT
jgi:factor associated with neutral sphingomyelinase activation